MKTTARLVMIALAALLAAACASAPAAPTAPYTQAAAASGGQPTEDITLVGTTGRPQFLDSFAHW